jgi:hypothetical protein
MSKQIVGTRLMLDRMVGFALLSPTYDVALNEDVVNTRFETASDGKSGHGWPF